VPPQCLGEGAAGMAVRLRKALADRLMD
jgi:hypothetical protein